MNNEMDNKHVMIHELKNKKKDELLKHISDYHIREFKLRSEAQEIYNNNQSLKMELTQLKNDNKILDQEIKEYDKKFGMIEQLPIEENNNIEYTNIIPPCDQLSDYKIWKNHQNNIIYRKKIFKEIKNKNNDKNNVKFDECCICYEENNSFKIKTNCKHDICMSCILKMNKKDCPMCREPFPKEITCLLNKEPEYAKVFSSQPRGIDSWFSWSGTPATYGSYL